MFAFADATWINPPDRFQLDQDRLTIHTDPHTDLWQRTFSGVRRDNAHMLCTTTPNQSFSLTAKVDFAYRGTYDQAGLVIYLDSDNWAKTAIEYGGDRPTLLGSVVTNYGYSDWATQEVPADWTSLWYRLSRRQANFRIEASTDGVDYHQLRVFHLAPAGGDIRYGLMACSPNDGSFEATFSQLSLSACVWRAD